MDKPSETVEAKPESTDSTILQEPASLDEKVDSVKPEDESAVEGSTNGEPSEQDMDLESDQRLYEPNKRVKVYRLEGACWQDTGTGFVEGIYDQHQDEAMLLVVQEEETNAEANTKTESSTAAEAQAPGGFLRPDESEGPSYLLKSKVSKTGLYSRQQETLVVWTEPDGSEVALSFQDPHACSNICDFIGEVQTHLQLVYDEHAQMSSSSPAPMSPPTAHDQVQSGYSERENEWAPLDLGNLKNQAEGLRMITRSIAGRERTVQFVLANDYVRQMMKVFSEAEDLESLEDLHLLCAMMTIILTLNDNGLFEYLLQQDIFLGLAGIMEYDPEYPRYKASYREFLSETTRFKQVVKIEDQAILAKIHQTYRLHYLKDVILARVLDDPMFNILNSLLYFNQIDIIAHISNNTAFLRGIFAGFKDAKIAKSQQAKQSETEQPELPIDPKVKDAIGLLHQLMFMGKQVQAAHRTQLNRILVDNGIIYVCEFAFSRRERQVINQGAEMLSMILDHDLATVRSHCLREHGEHRKTIAHDITRLLVESDDIGLKSQMSDAIRSMLDLGLDPTDPPQVRAAKSGTGAESFAVFYYEFIAPTMYRPLLDLPEFKDVKQKPHLLKTADATLIQLLTETLATLIPHHGQRIQFFLLSNPIAPRVASLSYMKQKPLKHAALRFYRACLKTSNHFIFRHLIKYDLLLPLIEMLEVEGPRDNMLCSSCLDVFETIRKDNVKVIINSLFEKYDGRMQRLATQPNLKAVMIALRTRWEQNNEPPPPETEQYTEDADMKKVSEDAYFIDDTDDETLVGPPAPIATISSISGQKRKRVKPVVETKHKKLTIGQRGEKIRSLGLDYGDESNSDSESDSNASPRGRSDTASPIGLAPSAMPAEEKEGQSSPTPRIKLKLNATVPPAPDAELGEMASKMARKRMKEEEDEEEGGLANLMAPSRPPLTRGKAEESSNKDRFGAIGTAVKDAGKKIKLNLGFKKKAVESTEAGSKATKEEEKK